MRKTHNSRVLRKLIEALCSRKVFPVRFSSRAFLSGTTPGPATAGAGGTGEIGQRLTAIAGSPGTAPWLDVMLEQRRVFEAFGQWVRFGCTDKKTPPLSCVTALLNLVATSGPAGLLSTSIEGVSATTAALSPLIVQLTVHGQSPDHEQGRVNRFTASQRTTRV